MLLQVMLRQGINYLPYSSLVNELVLLMDRMKENFVSTKVSIDR